MITNALTAITGKLDIGNSYSFSIRTIAGIV
ncbi:hypothetical protein AMBR_MGDJBKAP_00734 [Leuconostoc pseudomesenteroides]|nr:hypothetical protein AMBR_MGDJBKAP_00734 [Leuconostoc pseudomesenteroides]